MVKLKNQKPHLLKVLPPVQNSFVLKGDEISWTNPWHFHPEIELLYCMKGVGTNFIGNCIREIEEGELLLFGSNLPHTRQRDKDYYLRNPDAVPRTIVVQFKEDFLGEKFFDVTEFQHIRLLLERAKRGLKFHGKTRLQVVERLKKLYSYHGAASILKLLELLNVLANTDEFEYLNNVGFPSGNTESATIDKVYRYTQEHFCEQIGLEQVAAITNHSTSAFCRYFKRHTRKSYFQYLNEVRIAYACDLLMSGDKDVSAVCFASGFNNLSHFHRQFKKIMKMAPSAYKLQSQKKVPGIAA
jgi:AraC-like DNA-binding protein